MNHDSLHPDFKKLIQEAANLEASIERSISDTVRCLNQEHGQALDDVCSRLERLSGRLRRHLMNEGWKPSQPVTRNAAIPRNERESWMQGGMRRLRELRAELGAINAAIPRFSRADLEPKTTKKGGCGG